MSKKTFVILIYIFSVLFAYSQDNTKKKSAAAATTTTTVKTVSWKDNSDAFLRNSIAKDIANSNFSQLKAMAKAVGLKECDNDSQYRTALYKYYGITNPNVITTKKQGNKIILEEAGELRMHTFKEEGEEFLHFFGKVKIKIDDKDENNVAVTKHIYADEIYIDLKNQEISGFGNVYFKDNKLEFNGNQLFYNFKIGRGVLFNGTTKISAAGKSGLDGMIFKGEKIIQADKTDNILQNGELTTCDCPNPHYSIKVKKVWINQDEEWGIMGLVYNVGAIPFLYIPIYYHPKGIQVNPVVGFRSREGWYFNSTYYILGEQSEVKKDGKDVLGIEANRSDPSGNKSTLQITSAKITEKLNMFYDSHEFYSKHPKMRFLPKNFQSLDLALRVFGDAYTNLGFYAGTFFYMNISHKNFPFKLKILTDYAASRLIYKDSETSVYLPYRASDQKDAVAASSVDLKNTYLFPSVNPLTFRTSQYLYLEGKIMPNYVNFSYSGQVEYVSDYDYFKDFYNRSRYFSYIDLMFDAIKYGIQSSSTSSSSSGVFKSKDETTVSGADTINTNFKFTLSPKKYYDIFGYKPLSNISLTAETKVVMKKTTFNEFSDTDELREPDYYKYMLSNFYAPTATFKASGELLNYKTFLAMPEKYREWKNKKNTPVSNEEKLEAELFESINNLTTVDVSKDTTTLSLMDVLPVNSKVVKSIVKKSDNLMKSDLYSYPTFSGGDYLPTKKVEAESKKTETKSTVTTQEDYRQTYNPGMTKPSSTINGIEIVNFNLTYDFSDSLSNQFIFNNDATHDTNKESDDGKLDSVERLFTGNFDMDKYLQRFNISNTLTYTMKGSFSLLAFTSSSKLLQMSPNFVTTYKKNYDDINIYTRFLRRTTTSTGEAKETAITKNIIARNLANRTASETTLYYTDTIKNDLSFGSKMFDGTGISTYMKIKIFKYNEQTSHYYDKLNELNENSEGYEPVDTLFYDNRCLYEKVESLYTNFTFKINVFDSTSPHTLNFSAGPKINWTIPSTYISEMKSEIWNDYLYDSTSYVKYTNAKDPEISGTELLTTLKDYLYYRKNASKLNKKINEFFKPENFWSGTKNFRKMLENITINANYSFKHNDITVVTASNVFAFVFENMGQFSARETSTELQYAEPVKAPFAIYPDDTLTLNFFNSMFTYSFSNKFSKELDKNYTNLISERQKLDEYKIIYFTQSHTFNFTLNDSLFPFKLGGNWMAFTAKTSFKWNRNIRWYNNDTHMNDFYLDSQTLDLKLLKNILQMGITFKYFDFKVAGEDKGAYGLELDSGYFAISYNVTEIPVFLKYFKLTINPVIRYDFKVKHEDYYASATSSTVTSINSDYYNNNKLSFYIGFDLLIGSGTPFETKIHFHSKSTNNKMYKYYSETGWVDFWDDLGASFRFDDIKERKRSNFNLQQISVAVSHSIHDWEVKFEYLGEPQKTTDSDGKNASIYWENTFSFEVAWKFNSSNQLMNMFKKTDLAVKYTKGEWQPPSMTLDAE